MSEAAIEKVGSRTPGDRPGPKGKGRKPAGKNIPDGAKKPADHQPAKTDVEDSKVVKVKWGTKPGEPDEDGNPTEAVPAEYTIDLEVFDDLDFVEAMIDMDAAGTEAERQIHAYRALRRMLGDKQLVEYKNNSRDPKTGRTSFNDSVGFFNHIVTATKQGNS